MAYLDNTLIRPEGIRESRSLSHIKDDGIINHYVEYAKKKSNIVVTNLAKLTPADEHPRSDEIECAKKATGPICNMSLHKMWEGIHLIVALIGIGMSSVVLYKYSHVKPQEPITKIEIVQPNTKMSP